MAADAILANDALTRSGIASGDQEDIFEDRALVPLLASCCHELSTHYRKVCYNGEPLAPPKARRYSYCVTCLVFRLLPLTLGGKMHIHRFTRSLLLTLMMLALAGTCSAGILLQINFAPPPLPLYEQPLCPGDGYIWTPGYWAYGDDGYFWVPGTWVLIPEPGFLWTPGYWGWEDDGLFVFHAGYWGPQIGFYGGINYGFGYVGAGYEGGYWNNGAFFYNRSVNN